MVSTSAPAAVIPLAVWAERAGVAPRTARRWADEGLLNGSDKDHPQAMKVDGRWHVAPHVYRVVEVVETAPQALDARTLAAMFREFADRLEQGVRA